MNIDIEERVQRARDLFREGYNCSQSVLLAYCDLFELNPTLAATLSAPLGGGLSRLREVCGAVSGMAMVAGLIRPYNDPAVPGAYTTLFRSPRRQRRDLCAGAGVGRAIPCRKRSDRLP